MASILLVRHGQASFAAADYDQLSPLGLEQARRLGLRLQGRRYSRWISGSLQRQTATLQGIRQAHGEQGDGEIDARFNEFDHEQLLRAYHPQLADVEGRQQLLSSHADPRKAFQRLFAQAWQRWLDPRHSADYSESWAAFRQRCQQALQEVVEDSQGDVLIVSSGGVIAALLQQLLQVADEQVLALNAVIYNASCSRLLYHAGRVSLSGFNDVAHLEDEHGHLLSYR